MIGRAWNEHAWEKRASTAKVPVELTCEAKGWHYEELLSVILLPSAKDCRIMPAAIHFRTNDSSQTETRRTNTHRHCLQVPLLPTRKEGCVFNFGHRAYIEHVPTLLLTTWSSSLLF